MIRTMLLVAALFAAASPTAQAQLGAFTPERIAVGDNRLRVDLIQPYTARWNVTIATPDNRLIETGYRLEELARGACARPCWMRTMRAFNARNEETMVTVNVFDAETLAPVSTEQRAPDGSGLRLQFDGRRVTGRQDVSAFFHVPEHHRDINGRVARRAFEFNNGPSHLYLALMPHSPMTTLRFPIVDVDADNPLAVADADYRIFNRQNLTVDGRTVPAVAIDAVTTYGYWQYWVTAEPPYAVRWLFVGPGGGRTMYTLAPAAAPG